MKLLKLYIVLSIISITCIIAAGEIMARYFVRENRLPAPPPYSKIDPYSPNPYIVQMRPFMHFHIPSSHYTQSRSYYSVDYSINSSGFRGPEIQPKAKNMKRAIIIGDSIVEGHGCEFKDTFSYKLGEKADALNWEVLNLGVQGASPSYFAANLDRYMATEPDAAIVVLFENDLYDDRILEKSYFNKPILDSIEQLLHSDDRKGILFLDNFRLFTLMKRGFKLFDFNETEQIIRMNNGVSTVNHEQIEVSKLSPWLVAPSMFDTQWQMSKKYLDITVRELQKNKIHTLIVNMTLGTLLPRLEPAHRNHAYMFNDRIEKWARANSLNFLSLLPTIEQLMQLEHPDNIMIKDDGHPTAKTHQIIADCLWKWLTESAQSGEKDKSHRFEK